MDFKIFEIAGIVGWLAAGIFLAGEGCSSGSSRCSENTDCPNSNQICNDGICCSPAELTELSCDNGFDDDCDRLIDCADPDCDLKKCNDLNPATFGDICQQKVCTGSDCLPQEEKEINCLDNIDSDCDDQTDCADPDCDKQNCDDNNPVTNPDVCANLVCRGADCVPDGTQEDYCADAKDNDCDQTTDCDDEDCVGKPKPCGRCDTGASLCSADHAWGECQGETGCEPDTIGDCGTGNCGKQKCLPTCVYEDCVEGNPKEVCDETPTGVCRDYLISEGDARCTCQKDVPAPNCVNVGMTYSVNCSYCGYCCVYERREITEKTNCHWECQ